ncbi:MAG TPA: hypothetical protein VFL91_06695 [Thermomicrobiales bacterium]|nr:hypothetical protein [Thermomicrobiales bacterium]
MSNKHLRDILRIVHLVAAVLIGVLVYSPLAHTFGFVLFLRIIVFPVIAIAGVWMWQMPRVRKLFRGNRANVGSATR